jgi:hypothetical protein
MPNLIRLSQIHHQPMQIQGLVRQRRSNREVIQRPVTAIPVTSSGPSACKAPAIILTLFKPASLRVQTAPGRRAAGRLGLLLFFRNESYVIIELNDEV